jgi:hypothetical protein
MTADSCRKRRLADLVTCRSGGRWGGNSVHAFVVMLCTFLPAPAQWPPCLQLDVAARRTAERVLDQRLSSLQNPQTSEPASVLGDLISDLRARHDSSADEALCVLVNFYLGEANDGDVMYQITARGTPLIPNLVAMKGKRPCVDERYAMLFHEERRRLRLLDLAIKAIENDKVIGAE